MAAAGRTLGGKDDDHGAACDGVQRVDQETHSFRLEDGFPCLVATTGPDGPNISPKGSLIVFDDDHLAYWERSKKKALENVQADDRVVVVYSKHARPARRPA